MTGKTSAQDPSELEILQSRQYQSRQYSAKATADIYSAEKGIKELFVFVFEFVPAVYKTVLCQSLSCCSH